MFIIYKIGGDTWKRIRSQVLRYSEEKHTVIGDIHKGCG